MNNSNRGNKIICAPDALYDAPDIKKTTVFLGGTIDMCNSVDWQRTVADNIFAQCSDVILYNPRRDDWDASWEQVPENRVFRQQVEWELEAQERADLNVYYFGPNSKSPITLLELGLFLRKPCVVYCPKEFYRYGNIKLVCERYRKSCFDNEEEFCANLVQAIIAKQSESDK